MLEKIGVLSDMFSMIGRTELSALVSKERRGRYIKTQLHVGGAGKIIINRGKMVLSEMCFS